MYETIKNTIGKSSRIRWYAAILALLALVLSLSVRPAPAASWMDPYLNTLVDWGVMRGDIDGNLREDEPITRAEFVSMVNRAYGYEATGYQPFVDVPEDAWFRQDIETAYNVGYFAGTSEVEASPYATLTREQATVILARNLMLEETVNESLGFTDSRDFSTWSRGYIQPMAELGIVSGYTDGSFRHDQPITRGEVGVMLVRAIGTPIRVQGTHSLGNVYNNVTVTTAGVTLKDTDIAGDLYLTGGVGLGDIVLDNVTVMGQILASGGGESHKGESSISLKNVSAVKMTVDSISDQYVTIQALGDTQINNTYVKTASHINDATAADYGLSYIEVDGPSGAEFSFAGNLKEIVNRTPDSYVIVDQAAVNQFTVDEDAVNSELNLTRSALVNRLNLDTATDIYGGGDVAQININAPGVVADMLPDEILIRPGLMADIYGQTMDSTAAAQASADPRILAGYPDIHNVGPESADATFQTNKPGTLYWAVSSITDGSIDEDDVISPTDYDVDNEKIIDYDSIEIDEAETDYTDSIDNLEVDTPYYLSVIFVDDRDHRSPLKVTAFTTADDTKPEFADGYPFLSKITSNSVQVTTMSTKTCDLYYALLPKGSAAPTIQDFKNSRIEGDFGQGTRDARKNIIDVFTANSRNLREEADYDLYLVLIDGDGGQYSDIKKLSFTTLDGTPPVFLTEPTVTQIQNTSVRLNAILNENGTIYWVAVPQGTQYPKAMAGQTEPPELSSEDAKRQVENGLNLGEYGVAGNTRATGERDTAMNVSGLQPQSSYDLYYVAKDEAGNYSDTVKKITIHTLDTGAPIVRQEFSRTADEAGLQPMPNTNIRIIFSENVQDTTGEIFLTLYEKTRDRSLTDTEREAAAQKLAELLRNNIQLCDADIIDTDNNRVIDLYEAERTGEEVDKETEAWIDYRDLDISMENGEVIFLFRNGENINLSSGGTYYFRIADIADTSDNKNFIKPNPQNLPEFTTVFAQVRLREGVSDEPKNNVRMDMSFSMYPMSTDNVADNIYYDVLLWSDLMIEYNVYARILDENNDVVRDTSQMSMFGESANVGTTDSEGWFFLGEDNITTDSGNKVGKSLNRLIRGSNNPTFSPLRTLRDGWRYEIAIEVTQVLTEPDYESWSDEVRIYVTIPAGTSTHVTNLAANVTEARWEQSLAMGVSSIGTPDAFDFYVYRQFTDTSVPSFTEGYPEFETGDTVVNMQLMLNREGTIYYVVAPMGDDQGNYNQTVATTATHPTTGNRVSFEELYVMGKNPPTSGANLDDCPQLIAPSKEMIYTFTTNNNEIKYGSLAAGSTVTDLRLEGLNPRTTYFAYFVMKGQSQELSRVFLFQFTTQEVTKPAIILDEDSPFVNVQTTTASELEWILYATNSIFPLLRAEFYTYVDTDRQAEFRSDWAKYFSRISATTPGATYTTPTVLDALLTSLPDHSDYSVFDEFASDTGKTLLLERVQRQESSGTPPTDNSSAPLELTARQIVQVGPKNMTEETYYYFIAAAKHPMGSEYSFKAVGGVHVPDEEAPDYEDLAVATDYIASKTGQPDTYKIPYIEWKDQPYSYYYKGSISIEFTERVYLLRHSANNERELVTLTAANLPENIVTTGGSQMVISVTNPPGAFIQLNFEGVKEGDSLIFFRDGVIADAYENTHAQGQRLRLTFTTDNWVETTDPTAVERYVCRPTFIAQWEN